MDGKPFKTLISSFDLKLQNIMDDKPDIVCPVCQTGYTDISNHFKKFRNRNDEFDCKICNHTIEVSSAVSIEYKAVRKTNDPQP